MDPLCVLLLERVALLERLGEWPFGPLGEWPELGGRVLEHERAGVQVERRRHLGQLPDEDGALR